MWLYLRKETPGEDALTGALADVLSWSESATIMRSLLEASWAFDGNRTRPGASPALSPWTSFAIEPWPRWPAGEPDLVARLINGTDTCAVVVFEAKCGAPKSGVDTEGSESATPPATDDGDQLGRYFAHAVSEGLETAVVYLTHHVLPPDADLRASYASMLRRVPAARPEQLRWLSWRHVERVLREAALAEDRSALGRCVDSVASVLRNCGFRSFEGRWPGGLNPPPAAPTTAWWAAPPGHAYQWPRGILSSPATFYTNDSEYDWTGPGGRRVAERHEPLFWK